MGSICTCDYEYNLLDEGRKYSGNHRKYLIENAREICYSPATRERIKLREALGYYGHGRRQIAGKMEIGETECVVMPDGSKVVVDNVPSNVTLAFDIDKDGRVTHKQEILDTSTGQIVSNLQKNKVGGFSWACPGRDGGTQSATIMTGFSGFDYVLRPGFAKNRGYVLESAEGSPAYNAVFEAVQDADKTKAYIQFATELYENIADNDLLNAVDANIAYREELSRTRNTLVQAQAELAGALATNTDLKAKNLELENNVRGIWEAFQEKLPFFIPEPVIEEILKGNFTRAKMIFEEAGKYDASSLPIGAQKKPEPLIKRREQALYGTADYGFGLKL